MTTVIIDSLDYLCFYDLDEATRVFLERSKKSYVTSIQCNGTSIAIDMLVV